MFSHGYLADKPSAVKSLGDFSSCRLWTKKPSTLTNKQAKNNLQAPKTVITNKSSKQKIKNTQWMTKNASKIQQHRWKYSSQLLKLPLLLTILKVF